MDILENDELYESYGIELEDGKSDKFCYKSMIRRRGALERMADQFLKDHESDCGSDDVVYKFYSNESTFREACNREELKDDVILFLDERNKRFGRHHIVDRRQKINVGDLIDFRLHETLMSYKRVLDAGGDKVPYKLKKDIRSDMLLVKDKILGTIYFKHVSLGGEKIEYGLFNFTDAVQVKALLRYKTIIGDGDTVSDDLKVCFGVLEEIILKADLSDDKVLGMYMNDDSKLQDIADELGLDISTISKRIDSYVDRIVEVYNESWREWVELELIRGNYKKCVRCSRSLLVRHFGRDIRNKDGLNIYCKSCRQT